MNTGKYLVGPGIQRELMTLFQKAFLWKVQIHFKTIWTFIIMTKCINIVNKAVKKWTPFFTSTIIASFLKSGIIYFLIYFEIMWNKYKSKSESYCSYFSSAFLSRIWRMWITLVGIAMWWLLTHWPFCSNATPALEDTSDSGPNHATRFLQMVYQVTWKQSSLCW